MITLKPIKPKANLVNINEVERAVRATMERAADDVLEDLESTTEHWEREVRFGKRVTREGFEVSTNDDIYSYVDEGTKAHDITPKNAKMLRFAVGGGPKTTPRVIGSTPGRRGSQIVRAKRVRHPGTKAREFTNEIQKKYDREVPLRIGQALGDVIDRGGD